MKRLTEKAVILFCMVGVVAVIALPVFAADVPVSGLPLSTSGSLGPAAGSPEPDAVKENVRVRLTSLPLTFIPNRGQYDPAVVYMVTGPKSILFFTHDDIVILTEEKIGNGIVSHMVRQTFPGASAHPVITGTDMLAGTANFFTGNDPSKWQTNIPTYGAVEYHNLYPGIDLRYEGTEGTLKREFVVAPGADPSVIRLRYDGVDTIAVDGSGNLVLTTGRSTMTESPLICYQEINGKVIPVSAAYRLLDDHEVAFMLGQYDPAFPLVIDPRLVYSTCLGGSNGDDGTGIAVDGSGNAYVTGETSSTNFPTTGKGYDQLYGGNWDAFVTKLNAAGSGLVYSTYLGGTGSESGIGIAVDGGGNASVTGQTSSSDFPTTFGAYNQTYGAAADAFVTRLSASGSYLLYSTYLGGGGNDFGNGIAVDGGGNASVTGYTSSSDFPTTPGAYNRTYGGATDAFVTRLNAAGSGLVYSTYLGGTDDDEGYGIAVDGSGNASVTGYTSSSDFPTTSGAYNQTYGGNEDVFVTKLNAAGSGLVYSTYLGGTDDDEGYGIALDGSRNASVTGYTYSSDFPTTPGAYDRTMGGTKDAFVTRLNTAGSGLVYSTYLGGTDDEEGYGIAMDGGGNAYVTGYTSSADFPTTAGAYNQTHSGASDVYVTKLNAAGSGLVYSTYLGGTDGESGTGIALDGSRNAYVTGYTYSSDFPTTAGAYDPTYNTNSDAFVAKFSLAGSGLSGVGVFRNSSHKFYLKNGSVTTTVNWGQSTDTPVTGDWNGDGLWDVGVFRNSTHMFLLKNGTKTTSQNWGVSTDTPVTGDWNGDGLWDVGVFRNASHTFYLKNGTKTTSQNWGVSTDTPVTGDWNGDGLWDVGVFRNATHMFYLKNGSVTTAVNWGVSTDTPVTGDWNGDGLWDVGVFRNATHMFYLKNGSVSTKVNWGQSTDTPVTGKWS